MSLYEELAARAAEHGFLVCSDEAYSEIWFDETPVSALQAVDRTRVVVFNTLSKRSSMPGYRSGFVAGPAEVIAALKAFRPTVGTAPQEFVQRASVVAWSDEEHVRATRALYRRKRDLVRPALEEGGFRIAGSEASFFLWFAVPEGESSEGSRRGCSSTGSSSRRAPTSGPPARGMRGSRSSRARRSASGRRRS